MSCLSARLKDTFVKSQFCDNSDFTYIMVLQQLGVISVEQN